MYSNGNNRPAVYDGKIAGLYDLEETLGSGHFAVVKLARHVFTGEKVAVKVIDKNKLDEVSRAHLFQEVRCMKLVQHPHVVRLYEVIDTQTKLYLILELGDGGDLYDYIMKHEGGLSEDLAREYFRQIVRAISYCHQLHVVHRDLKPENVLFFEKLGVVKLTDFGFSNKFCPGQKLQTSCGSLAYSAPEILLGDSYDAPAVDVWSLGVILYMLVCGHPPFQEANDSETLTMIMDCKYTVPAHVSPDCQDLISRMLVRQPDKRATLKQIAEDRWLTQDGPEFIPECLPLVSRQQVSEEDHNFIIQKMVNGNIGAKEDILEALDKNEYNHITATYFLLAERKLRSHRQEQALKRRPELSLPVSNNSSKMLNRNELPTNQDSNHLLIPPSAGHLNALLTPGADGTASGRARKCSIVQEEDDDEDDADHDDLTSSLNRRGSRSEGRINLAVQDRIAESELLKKDIPLKTGVSTASAGKCVFDGISGVTLVTSADNDIRDKLGKIRGAGIMRRPNDFRPRTATDYVPKTVPNYLPLKDNAVKDPNVRSSSVDHSYDALNKCRENDPVSTKFLTDSSTISIPIPNQQNTVTIVGPPKYKTMPSPTRANTILPGANCLNEIFEEGTDIGSSDTSATTTPRPVARHTTFTNSRTPPNSSTASGSSHRRTKFHKTRTASCSSSDDDDSENRKKRAHKIVDSHKSFQPQRRDSNDDSSDSQDPGSGATAGSNSSSQYSVQISMGSGGDQSQGSSSQTNGTNTNTNGTQKCGQQVGYRRHRAGRRRTGETRLRESQSLNRITEVQESEAPQSLANQSQNATSQHTPSTTTDVVVPTTNIKSGKIARLFHGFRKSDTSSHASESTKVPSHLDEIASINSNTKNSTSNTSINSTTTAADEVELALGAEIAKAIKVTAESKGSAAAKKLKLLGKYFQVHKKICIPLPGIFQRGRLYKAQSCGSIVREKVNQVPIKGSVAVTPKARSRHSVFYTEKNHIVTGGIDPRLLSSKPDTT